MDKIRIRLKGYDFRILDQSLVDIVSTANNGIHWILLKLDFDIDARRKLKLHECINSLRCRDGDAWR